MQLISFVHMMKEIGYHFSTPLAVNIMSTKWTKTYFGGQLLSEYVMSFLVLSYTLSNYLQTLQMIYMGKGSAFTGYRSAPKHS